MYIKEDLLRGVFARDMSNVKYDTEEDTFTFTFQELGILRLPTGKIVANDPMMNYQTDAFCTSVEPGSYPVEICVAANEVDDKRVAAAMIRFSDNAPERFEMALVEIDKGRDLSDLGDDDFLGYGVDAGTGGFYDASAAQQLDKQLEHEIEDKIPKSEMTIDKMLASTYVPTYSTANFDIPGTEVNVIAFSSGWGDGCYPCYWGYAKGEDKPCCLITDFLVL